MQSVSSVGEPTITRIRRARREDVVDAAVTVLDRDGYAAASVEAIAREAGTSKSTVLYHFGSRADVMVAVVGELFASGAAYMTDRVPTSGPRRAVLHAYVESNLRFIAAHAAHVRAVHRIQLGGGGTGPETPGVPSDDQLHGPLRQLLSSGQQSGELGAFDPAVAALTIRAIIDGASFHLTDQELDVEHYIDEVVALVDRAVDARAAAVDARAPKEKA